mgnify:CR=1 FL=1
MPYISTDKILKYATEHHIAHGAFNVNSLCQAEAIIEACEELRCAAIIQVAEPGLAYIGGRVDFLNGTMEEKILGAKRIAKFVKKLAKKTFIPVALHLDHGRSFESCKACINAGFNSVMIDGSALDYEDNVALVSKVVAYAHPKGVAVEGELGVLAGVEDHVFSESSTYTNPLTAVDFIKRTQCDSLAISYGTKHGAVKGDNVKLRKEIVIATMENLRHEHLSAAIVSHGSSLVPEYIVNEINALGGKVKGKGVPIDQLKEVIPCGISKINMDTDIRLATTRNLLEYFTEHPEKRETSKIYNLLVEKPESFEYRYYLKEYINELETNKGFNEELKEIVPLLKKAVKEIVLTANVEFGSIGDAIYIK